MANLPRIEHEVTGRLTADPVLRTNPQNQEQFVTFRLAENHRRMNQQTQQWEDADPTFYDISIPSSRERLGQNVMASLAQGDLVSVKGDYAARAYVSQKTNEAVLGHHIWAKDVAPSLGQHPVEIQRSVQGPGQQSGAQMQGQQMQGQQGFSSGPFRQNNAAPKPNTANMHPDLANRLEAQGGWDLSGPGL